MCTHTYAHSIAIAMPTLQMHVIHRELKKNGVFNFKWHYIQMVNALISAMKKCKRNEVDFGRNAKTRKKRNYTLLLHPSFDASFDTHWKWKLK